MTRNAQAGVGSDGDVRSIPVQVDERRLMIYTKLARAVFGTVFAAQYPKSRLVDDEVIDEAENDKDEKEDHSRFALKIVKPRLEA